MRALARLVAMLGLLVAAPALLVGAVWVGLDNPTISEGRDGSDTYTCLAPYDTVLNGADNFPGGEPPVNGDLIAAKCRGAGRDRFRTSAVLGVAGLLSAIAAGAALVTSRGRVGAEGIEPPTIRV